MGKSKKKQEVTIADQSDNAILTLWEQDIGSLELAQSYSITKLLVRVSNGDHYLSKPAHGSTVQIIDDINNVQEDITDSVEPSSVNCIVNLKVPSSKGVSFGLESEGNATIHKSHDE